MDETVVVTDAALGLGAAIARGFAAEGVTVVYGGPDDEEVNAVTKDIEAAGGTAIGLRTDARDQFDLERLMETAARSAGPVSVLIPAATVDDDPHGEQALPAVTYSAFDDAIRTNLRGRFAAVREAVPHLADDGLVLVPIPGGGDVRADRSRSRSISAAGARGLVAVAALDLDQSVVGIELDLPMGGEPDVEAIEAVAETFADGSDRGAEYDGRTLSIEEVRDGT